MQIMRNKWEVKSLFVTYFDIHHFLFTIKELINDGRLGDIISVNHEECVGNVHQSHSFVRGNWGNSKRSSCMLLQKSCHDMDILQWLIGKKCKKYNLLAPYPILKEENAPKDAPDYCIQGCPKADTCPYNAVRLYLDDKENELVSNNLNQRSKSH